MGTPPPLDPAPQERPPGTGSSILRQAAVASVVTPWILLGLSKLGNTATPSIPEGIRPVWSVGIGCVVAMIILVGLGFALMGLTGGLKGQGRGLVVPSTFGLILNGLAAVAFGTGVLKGVQQQVAVKARVADLHQTFQREVSNQLRKFDSNSPEGRDPVQTVHEGNESLTRIQKELASAARDLGGNGGANTVALEAAGAYLKKLQVLSREYEQQLSVLQKTDPANPSTLQDKADLAPRRVAIRAFLDANERLTDYLTHSEEKVVAELNSRNVSPASREAFLSSFRKGKSRQELVLRIRETDRQIGEGMLAMLLLYEQQWGEIGRAHV